MKKLIPLFIATTLFAPSLFADKGTEEPLLIEVSGQGQVEAEPDIAILNATLIRSGQNSRALLDQVSAEMARVIGALKAAGIDARAIQAGQVRLQQQWRRENGRNEPNGYELQRPISLRIKPIERYPEILDLLSRNGVNTLGGINYEFSNRQALSDQALLAASEDALRTATLLARSAGAKNCRAVALSSGQTSSPPPMMRMAMMESSDSYNPGTQTISSQVSGRFACR